HRCDPRGRGRGRGRARGLERRDPWCGRRGARQRGGARRRASHLCLPSPRRDRPSWEGRRLDRPFGAGADAWSRPARQRHSARPPRGDAAAPRRASGVRRGRRPRLRHGWDAAGAQGAVAWSAGRRRLGDPPGAGRDCVPHVDRPQRAHRRDARHSAAVNQYLIAILWAVVGAAGGIGVRWGSVRLAVLEGDDLKPGHKWWQVFGPPVLSAVVFGIYGYEISSFGVLVVRSIFVLVLVQVIFFDFEY